MAKEDLKTKVLERASEEDVELVNIQFTDIWGSMKNVTIPVGRLEEALDHGVWFDGSSIDGFTKIHESDMYLVPDENTFSLIPWKTEGPPVARMIADVHTPDGKPFEGCPRNALKKMLENARDAGFIYNTGPELEFFLFKTDNGTISAVPHDSGGYFDHNPRDSAHGIRREIINALHSFGIEVEMSHHEVAAGQHEINFKYGDALRTADNAQMLKYTVKSIAHINGLHGTFMPKPIEGVNGSGMHVHQSLFTNEGETVMYDSEGEFGLSETAKSFIAGQLSHVKGMAAVLSPTVNSYKRLVPGYEAPVYICWGPRNRSALIRIPRVSKGREASTRLELRCPDPSTNPYLAFAAMLGSGLDGIEKKLEVPEPQREDLYGLSADELKKRGIETLPGSLGEAIGFMEESKFMEKTLGEHIYSKYLEGKNAEWDNYRLHVSNWELDNYLSKY